MVLENEENVGKVAQPDLEGLPQPDTDPGVIDVDDEAIEEDGDGEEESEGRRNAGDVSNEPSATIELDSSPRDAREQKAVDVIDLEEDDEGEAEGDVEVEEEHGEAKNGVETGSSEEDGEENDAPDPAKRDRDEDREDDGTPPVGIKDVSGDEISPAESDEAIESEERENEKLNLNEEKPPEISATMTVECQQHDARPQLASDSGELKSLPKPAEQSIGEDLAAGEAKDTALRDQVQSESQIVPASVGKASKETIETGGGSDQHQSPTSSASKANERPNVHLLSSVGDELPQTALNGTNDGTKNVPEPVEGDRKDTAAQVTELAPNEHRESKALGTKEPRGETLAQDTEASDMKPQESSNAIDSDRVRLQEVGNDVIQEIEIDDTQVQSKSEDISDFDDGDDEEVVEEGNVHMDTDLTDDEPVQEEQLTTHDGKPEELVSSKTGTGSTDDNQILEHYTNDVSKVDDSQLLGAYSGSSDAVPSAKQKVSEIDKEGIGKGPELATKAKVQPKALDSVDEVNKAHAAGSKMESDGDISLSEKASLTNNELEEQRKTPPTEGPIHEEDQSQKGTDLDSKMDIVTPVKELSSKGSANMNLTAPLFGMQTMELPKGPVSFSSPPSFQRSRLSPSAPPFIPAAHRDARNAATPQTKAIPATEMDVDSSRTEENPTAHLKAELAKPFEGSAVREPKLKSEEIAPSPSDSQPSDTRTSSVKVLETGHMSQAGTDQADGVESVVQVSRTVDQAPALLKTPQTLSVKPDGSQPTVPKISAVSKGVPPEGMPHSEKDVIKEESKSQQKKVSFGSIETITVPKAPSQKSTMQPSQVSTSESETRVEEQELKEEENDDGSVYEVSHVPISVRIGNGTAMKRDSLSTLRLAISKSGEAKLEMFKEAASSLLLFESLSNTRNTIRIRKVAKRTVVTITLMTNNSGGAQVAKKYYVPLGKHIYDKLFNILVIHLNDGGPARPGVESTPSSSSGKKAAPSSGSDAEGPQTVAGKRSLDVSDKKDPKRVKVAERRKQLLETKAKLLENLKAARKNKTGTGTKDHPVLEKSLKRTAATPIPPSSLSTSSQLRIPSSMTPKSTALPIGTSSTPAPLANTTQDTAIHSENPGINAPGLHSTDVKAPNQKAPTRSDTAVAGQTAGVSKPKPGQPLQAPPLSTSGKRPRSGQQPHRLQPGQNPHAGQGTNSMKKMRVIDEKSHAAPSGSNINVQDKLRVLRDRARRGGYTGSLPIPIAGRRDVAESEELKKLRSLLDEKTRIQTQAEKQKVEAIKGMTVAKEETKMAREAAQKTLDALSKAKEEVTKKKSEVSTLLEERREIEKELTAKRAENDLSVRQKAELDAQVSKLLKHVESALSAENALEHQKKESFSRCDHNNVSDFFDRLWTFKPSTWPVMEDSDIGARACARHGWYNSGVNVLRSTEGVELRLRNLYEDADVHLEEMERVTTALVQEHQFLSGWRGKQCARDIGKELLDQETLKKNVSEIEKHDVKTRVKGFPERADRLCALIAACGWKPYGKAVRCEWCGAISVGDLHLRESHYKFCMFAEEQDEVRRNIELLGLDWEVEGDRLGWFFRSSYGDVADTVRERISEQQGLKDEGGDVVMAG